MRILGGIIAAAIVCALVVLGPLAFAGGNGVGSGGLNGFPAAGSNAADFTDGGALGGCTIIAGTIYCPVGKFDTVDAGNMNVQGQLGVAGNVRMTSNDTQISWPIGYFSCGATSCNTNNDFAPAADNNADLGIGGKRWKTEKVMTVDIDTALTFTNVLCSATAPAVSSGFGGSPSIPANNGSCAFTINVGTGGAASTGVLTFGSPAAATGWKCSCDDLAAAVGLTETRQSASSTTTCTIANVNTATGVAAAWAASEVLTCSAFAY